MFWGKKRRGRKERDQQLEKMMALSQHHLLTAATETANAAQDVTFRLKARLDDSLRQFENTARILNDALFLTEMNGTIQSFNPAAGRMFGRTELVGLNIIDLFQNGDLPLTDSHALWTMAEQSSIWLPNVASPLRGRRPDGVLFWIEPSITRLDWSNGNSSMLVLIRNMDPLVGLADSSRQNRNYKALFDASYDGIMIEQNDRIVAANPAITRLFGYDPAEILNRPVAVLFESSEHAKVEANDDEAHFCVQSLHANGTHMPVVFLATRITWSGRPARLITIKDTSDLPQPEEISARRDNGVDMICCFDLNYRITFANASFLNQYGLTRSEILNRDIRFLMTSIETAQFMNNLDGLTVDSPSSRIQTQEGGLVFDWIDHAVFDDAGNPIEYQRVGRDITAAVAGLIKKP